MHVGLCIQRCVLVGIRIDSLIRFQAYTGLQCQLFYYRSLKSVDIQKKGQHVTHVCQCSTIQYLVSLLPSQFGSTSFLCIKCLAFCLCFFLLPVIGLLTLPAPWGYCWTACYFDLVCIKFIELNQLCPFPIPPKSDMSSLSDGYIIAEDFNCILNPEIEVQVLIILILEVDKPPIIFLKEILMDILRKIYSGSF